MISQSDIPYYNDDHLADAVPNIPSSPLSQPLGSDASAAKPFDPPSNPISSTRSVKADNDRQSLASSSSSDGEYDSDYYPIHRQFRKRTPAEQTSDTLRPWDFTLYASNPARLFTGSTATSSQPAKEQQPIAQEEIQNIPLAELLIKDLRDEGMPFEEDEEATVENGSSDGMVDGGHNGSNAFNPRDELRKILKQEGNLKDSEDAPDEMPEAIAESTSTTERRSVMVVVPIKLWVDDLGTGCCVIDGISN